MCDNGASSPMALAYGRDVQRRVVRAMGGSEGERWMCRERGVGHRKEKKQGETAGGCCWGAHGEARSQACTCAGESEVKKVTAAALWRFEMHVAGP